MAINKVIYGDQTLIDITDTTASTNDVLEGQVFYSAGGTRSVGTLSDATQSTHGLMSATDKIKLDGINLLGVKLNTTALTPDSNGYISIPLMTGATSSANGTAGLIPAPTTADAEKFFRGDGTWQDGGRPMVILSYGNSTWDDFITAYNNHVIVYCRASSNSNPKTGSQTRMAFMAYVNNADTPTEVEFQYYRSMSSHSATQMGDQVYVYKLTNKNAWTVTVREASVKQVNVSGNGLTASWSNNQVTLSNTMTAADMPMSSSDATTVGSAISGQSQAIANVNSKVEPQSIPLNSDLNNYISTGVYYIASNAVAAEIANTPVDMAGTLSVTVFGNSPMSGNWANLIQTYTSLNGIVYNRRMYTDGTGTMIAANWQQLATDLGGTWSVTISYSLASGAQYNTNLKTLIDSNLPSGYRCIGISGFTTGDIRVYFVSCFYGNSNYSFQIKNTSTNTVSENATVYYLYARN